MKNGFNPFALSVAREASEVETPALPFDFGATRLRSGRTETLENAGGSDQ